MDGVDDSIPLEEFPVSFKAQELDARRRIPLPQCGEGGGRKNDAPQSEELYHKYAIGTRGKRFLPWPDEPDEIERYSHHPAEKDADIAVNGAHRGNVHSGLLLATTTKWSPSPEKGGSLRT